MLQLGQYMSRCFNPRSCTRSDRGLPTFEPINPVFQSTLLHEERPTSDIRSQSEGSKFQSTLPHEERQDNTFVSLNSKLFQSTLPHEERRLHGDFLEWYNSRFQSTLPHEERQVWTDSGIGPECFNPRSRTRSDVRDDGQ